MSVIDGSTNTVSATIPEGFGYSRDVAVDPSTHTVYVTYANFDYSGISVIDGLSNTIVATVPGEYGDVGVDPSNHTVYATDFNDGTVVVISAENAPTSPAINSLSRHTSTLGGGKRVTITGSHLAGATTVDFSNTRRREPRARPGQGARHRHHPSRDEPEDRREPLPLCTATTPAHSPGTVHMQVTTVGGANTPGSTDKYTYR